MPQNVNTIYCSKWFGVTVNSLSKGINLLEYFLKKNFCNFISSLSFSTQLVSQAPSFKYKHLLE